MSHRKHALATPVDPADHVIGPADAPVTVVEYGDFECPFCAQAAPGIQLMLRRYGGRVRFAYRHFLQEDVHPHAMLAAEAAESAAGQGQFWPMHDLLFRHPSKLARTDLNGYARELDLDAERFKAEMDSHAHVPRIRGQARTGSRSGVRATPGLFVNGRILDVAFDLQALYDAVERTGLT